MKPVGHDLVLGGRGSFGSGGFLLPGAGGVGRGGVCIVPTGTLSPAYRHPTALRIEKSIAKGKPILMASTQVNRLTRTYGRFAAPNMIAVTISNLKEVPDRLHFT